MKIAFSRTQEQKQTGGFFSKKIETFYCLKVRMEVTTEEKSTMEEHKLLGIVMFEDGTFYSEIVNRDVPLGIIVDTLLQDYGYTVSRKQAIDIDILEGQIKEEGRKFKRLVDHLRTRKDGEEVFEL